jgi:hypothetical protein
MGSANRSATAGRMLEPPGAASPRRTVERSTRRGLGKPTFLLAKRRRVRFWSRRRRWRGRQRARPKLGREGGRAFTPSLRAAAASPFPPLMRRFSPCSEPSPTLLWPGPDRKDDDRRSVVKGIVIEWKERVDGVAAVKTSPCG